MAEDKRKPMMAETFFLAFGSAMIFALFFIMLAVVPTMIQDLPQAGDPSGLAALRAAYAALAVATIGFIVYLVLRRKPVEPSKLPRKKDLKP